MLKSPFRGKIKPKVTQEYGNTSFNDWYKKNDIFSPFHNGIDIILGNAKETYGTEMVCPFKTATVVKVTWDTPTATKGNGVTLEGEYEGKLYQVVLWHTGEIAVKLGQKLKEGDLICYVGNSGLCQPKPNGMQPWNGSHCHLMLFEYIKKGKRWILQNEKNGVKGAIDPRKIFDFTQWYQGNDSGLAHDSWVLKQYLDKMTPSMIVTYLRDILKI